MTDDPNANYGLYLANTSKIVVYSIFTLTFLFYGLLLTVDELKLLYNGSSTAENWHNAAILMGVSFLGCCGWCALVIDIRWNERKLYAENHRYSTILKVSKTITRIEVGAIIINWLIFCIVLSLLACNIMTIPVS
jgi:hypothetical protein